MTKTTRLTNSDVEELKELKKREMLPHLYGWKWYSWAWIFFNSVNRFNFLCAANQISKSSTQIRKAIHWATCPELWPGLWPHNPKPTQFWYLYPTKPVCTTEFYEKWIPEFLPRGDMKKDKLFGWEEEIKNKEIWAIHFNSGVSIYFKTYEQDTQNLQTGTCYAIFADEELPMEHFQELRSRLNATHGYFHMCFTATIGQDEWRRTMEPANELEELHKGALKLQISMYDCLQYKDGTKSFWTLARIKEIELECATEAEVQKRVYGKFILSGGLKYPAFNRIKNMWPAQQFPESWHIYTGTDIGSGGEKNHPAAIVMVAVRPDYKFGVVFRGWRGDNIQTTSSDILNMHQKMLSHEITSKGIPIKQTLTPVLQSYDWSSKDFFMVASSAGLSFTPADKKRDRGESLINTLFKLKMLAIMDEDPELAKLVVELTSLKTETLKTRAVDDFTDAMRYAIMPIPWDFDGVAGEIIKAEEKNVDDRSEAQKAFDERQPNGTRNPDQETEGKTSVEQELEEWQSYIDLA